MPQLTHDDTSRFDLVEGLRSFNYRNIVRPLLADYERRAGELSGAGRVGSPTMDEVAELYTRDPDYLFSCGIQHSMQQMAWTTAARAVERNATVEAERLRVAAESQQHSVLELDPTLELPEWLTDRHRAGRDDIHLVPGGYWAHDLVGQIYDVGGATYRLAWRAGYDARPGALEHFVRLAADAQPQRILDLGCSFGGLTRVLRKVFADADVIGLDLSAPALTYAHMLAEDQGQRIDYTQRDAAATGYEDDSFDLVTGFLLLHEVPTDVRIAIIDEAFRILRPGGQVLFLDIPPYSALSPAEAFFESFDDRGNGEIFWSDFLASDFPAVLRNAGFDQISDGPLDFEEPAYWGSSALWRTGEFDAVHRWVSRAIKPIAEVGS